MNRCGNGRGLFVCEDWLGGLNGKRKDYEDILSRM